MHHYSGLFSAIYLCPSDLNPAQLLAIKATSPSSETPPHDSKREARILSSLSHANVIKLLDNSRLPNSNTLLLVYPFQLLTLENLLDATKTKVQQGILYDIFSALAYIHSSNLIHRDIKPANILLSSHSGPARLCDFGIAWLPGDPASEPADSKITDVGTTCYRAPELLFGRRDYGEAIDLWAAGCVSAEVFVHNHKSRQENWTLFTAGALGSELALIKSIFETLGTPNARSWPESQHLPDWGKMTFAEFLPRSWEEILPNVEEGERDLVDKLVKYESGHRLKAAQVRHVSRTDRG